MNSLLRSASDAPASAAGRRAGRVGAGPVRRLLGTVGGARVGFVVVPMLSYWLAAAHHLDQRAVAAVMAGFGAGWAASAPIAGWLADRIGAQATITASSLLAAGAYLLLDSGLHHPAMLAAAALLCGATFDLYRPPLQAALTTHAHTAGADTTVLQRLYFVLNASRLASCLLAAALVTISWTMLFAVNAAANLLLAAVVARQPADLYTRTVRRTGAVSRTALADPRLLAITAITFAFYLVNLQSTVSLPVLLHAHGTTPPAYALLLALDPAVVITAQLAFGRWLSRLPLLVACAAGIALTAGGLAATGMTATVTAAAWLLPIWVTGELLVLTTAPQIVAAIAPPGRRGVYFGTWAATQGAGAVGAPLLAAAIPGRALWLAAIGLGTAAAAGALAWHRQTARP